MEYQEIRARVPQPPTVRLLEMVVRLGKFVLVLLIVPSILVFFRPKLTEQDAMIAKVETLKTERDRLLHERDKRVRRVEWIKNDDRYLEIEARDRLDLQKEGEYVIRFQDVPPQ
jgi:cell division protein FtsB